jgi:hypothetical protein
MGNEKGRFGNNINQIHRTTEIEKEKISVEKINRKKG